MIGEVLNERFKIEELLSEASMTTVYQALDLSLGKSCLVEVLAFNPNDAPNLPGYLEQLQALKQHYHPQIPRLQDVFIIEDELWPKLCLIHQQVDARPLRQLLEEKHHFSEPETVALLLQLARIVEYLHGLQPPYIHQGIRPENLLIGGDGKLYLGGYTLLRKDADGKAYPLDPSPDYTAPEQLRGEPGVTTDLYAIGLTGIEMLSGKHYTQLPNQDIHAHINVSTEFGNTLKHLVRDEPSQRIQTATALKNELSHVKRLVDQQQKDITVDAPIQRKQLLVPAIAGGLALIAAVILGFKLVTSLSTPVQADASPSPEPPPVHASPHSNPNPANNPASPDASAATAPNPANAPEVPVNIYKDFAYKAGELPPGIAAGETLLTTSPQPAEKLSKEPTYDGSGTIYGQFELGNGADHSYTFAINGSKVYIDKNNNEDLSDDGPPDSLNGPIDLKLENSVEGAPVAVPYQILFSPSAQGGYQFSSRCFYAGKVQIGDQSYDAVAFEDQTPDGLFQNNGLWIDINKNGNFETTEHVMDGTPLSAGNQAAKFKLNYP